MDPTLVFALLAVTLGAVLQRITGIGFVLVAGPLLVLVLDPYNGIVLANILSGVLAITVLARTYRDADWSIIRKLLVGLIIGMPLGVLVVRTLDPDALLVTVGGLTVFAVLLALFRRPMPFLEGRAGAALTGAVSAFSNATAGVGGPALAVYAASSRMPTHVFIPVVQVMSFVMNAIAVAAKAPFTLPLPLLLGSFGCIVVGMLLGSLLRRFVTPQRAQVLALYLALIGALAATVRGLFAVLG